MSDTPVTRFCLLTARFMFDAPTSWTDEQANQAVEHLAELVIVADAQLRAAVQDLFPEVRVSFDG